MVNYELAAFMANQNWLKGIRENSLSISTVASS